MAMATFFTRGFLSAFSTTTTKDLLARRPAESGFRGSGTRLLSGVAAGLCYPCQMVLQPWQKRLAQGTGWF